MKHTQLNVKRGFTDEEELLRESRIEELQLPRTTKRLKYRTHKKKNKQDWINNETFD